MDPDVPAARQRGTIKWIKPTPVILAGARGSIKTGAADPA